MLPFLQIKRQYNHVRADKVKGDRTKENRRNNTSSEIPSQIGTYRVSCEPHNHGRVTES